MKTRRKLALWTSAACLFAGGTSLARADVPTAEEPDYAQAVLHYVDRDYPRALNLLNELQRKIPRSVEVLELKAVVLKALSRSKDAGDVYRDLIRSKTEKKAPKSEIAPYAFELGVIRFHEKKTDQAEQYLVYSREQGFNRSFCSFYLGLISVGKQDWAQAHTLFTEVTASDLDEIKPAAHFYLGQAAFKLEWSSRGFTHMIRARDLARALIAREDVQPETKALSQQVLEGADKTLGPFDKSQFFGTASLLAGYDTNVLLAPNENAGNTAVSGQSTLKQTLSAGVGYATSPFDAVQLVPSARFNINKNFNKDSTAGEFADTTVALYVTRHPLSSFSYGAKTEGTIVFQNVRDITADSTQYSLYNTAMGIGPYAKLDVSRRWSVSADLGARYVKYNGEDTLQTSLRRSGPVFSGRISAQLRGMRFFSPTLSLRHDRGQTSGTEFRSRVWGLQLSNSFNYRDIEIGQTLDVSSTDYPEASAGREDQNILVAVSAQKKIGPRWSVLALVDYTVNDSTQEISYSYSRFTLNAGVSYNF